MYSICWACTFTFTTGYTFHVTNSFAVHKTCSLARVTANAFTIVNLHGKYADLVKESIKGSQRTEETTEGSEDEN